MSTSTDVIGGIYKSQVRLRGAKYERHIENLKKALRSADPIASAATKASNDGFIRLRTLGPSSVHIDAALASVSIQYQNGEYIGDYLMPPTKVGKQSDFYFIYDRRNRMGAPDDSIGVRGNVNETTESRSKDLYACVPRGLKNFVDLDTIANQDAPLDEMMDSVQGVSEDIALLREKRIAKIMTSTASYATNNSVTLTSSTQWNNGGGDPVGVIQDGRAKLFQGKGPSVLRMWSSLEVYNVLSRHPQLLDVTKYTNDGLVTPAQIARYFGFDEYLISEAREDTANEGQTEVDSRIWGKHFGMARIATTPGIRTASFGYTFRFDQILTDSWFEQGKGRKGGWWNRVSLSEDHKVVANDLGFLIANAVA